jgi:UDP-2-acetamido-3-amino-2,3-dideoxy-glucuronate N-acetyltransferase
VVGNPAKRRGWVCECGQKLPANLKCNCGRSYVLVDERHGLKQLTTGG